VHWVAVPEALRARRVNVPQGLELWAVKCFSELPPALAKALWLRAEDGGAMVCLVRGAGAMAALQALRASHHGGGGSPSLGMSSPRHRASSAAAPNISSLLAEVPRRLTISYESRVAYMQVTDSGGADLLVVCSWPRVFFFGGSLTWRRGCFAAQAIQCFHYAELRGPGGDARDGGTVSGALQLLFPLGPEISLAGLTLQLPGAGAMRHMVRLMRQLTRVGFGVERLGLGNHGPAASHIGAECRGISVTATALIMKWHSCLPRLLLGHPPPRAALADGEGPPLRTRARRGLAAWRQRSTGGLDTGAAAAEAERAGAARRGAHRRRAVRARATGHPYIMRVAFFLVFWFWGLGGGRRGVTRAGHAWCEPLCALCLLLAAAPRGCSS
jgi:hypothetical protein